EALYRDVMVLTEYLWQDKHRVKQFMRRLHREHSLARHSLNTLSVGLWLLVASMGENLKRRDLDRAALALLLHDLGMAKVPAFILSKTTPLKPDEKDKIPLHPLVGAKIMHKMGLAFDELRQCTLEHHERLDGSGYPQKLKGEQISRLGRICAVADSFSAMIAARPYAPGKDLVPAAQELAADKGRYDTRYATLLLNALVTNAFGTAKPKAEPKPEGTA
ncbi:MAG TPA: HD family phosphohydrolase, partial [Desulfovibrio sp.]|nr:HD family phosphohydrolase [Desulfovibrio sp.]